VWKLTFSINATSPYSTVSEELSSVETPSVMSAANPYWRVSEELSSVETY